MELFDGSPRERRLLIGMGVALAIAAVLFLLFGRSATEGPAGNDDLQAALRDLQIVESGLASRVDMEAGATAKNPFNRGALISSARSANLTISRVEPGSDGAFTVSFDGARSESVLAFLTQIERSTTGVITELDLEAITDERVEARVGIQPGS